MFDILVRFRKQVLRKCTGKSHEINKICKDYRGRSSPSVDLQHFRLTTVIYRISTASYLSIRVLLQVGYENEHLFPDIW